MTSPASLDYMMARYYSSSLGRFMAVDPGDDTEPENPQSWNRYVYVRNNPPRTIDPEGTQGLEFPMSQARQDQMAATGIAQQQESKSRAMEADANAKVGQAAVGAVCAAAPEIGERAGTIATGLLAAAPFTEGASLPAAGTAEIVSASAYGVAFACEPSPESAANLGAAALGAGVQMGTAKALTKAAVGPAVQAAVPPVTGAVAGALVKPALTDTAAMMCP